MNALDCVCSLIVKPERGSGRHVFSGLAEEVFGLLVNPGKQTFLIDACKL